MFSACLSVDGVLSLAQIKKFLEKAGRIWFTTDGWHSVKVLEFFCVTIHYLDSDYTPHNFVIRVRRMLCELLFHAFFCV